ncbi:clathrin interactor 1 [Senna tora]|uniref:Clathrin interactor 1 n=1 Tax=Senna tora TaxID=362788 RepID=A0A834WA55_9FABA|nr:clathrin interactor 1 [Senna tora]
MGSPLLHEIKKQASCFFKDKIRTARLILTDVTPVQLMTEEVTNENLWPPDTRAIGVISRAAFEVDDYWRIVEILHQRLEKFDKRNWRGSYKALILLEHLLTHGPLRVSEEFHCDENVIKEIGQLQYIDEKGFNWGLSVKKLSERILKLLKNNDFLREERARARELSRGIQGFGSFGKQTCAMDGSLNALPSKKYGRCNSHYDYHHHQSKGLEGNRQEEQVEKVMESKLLKQEKNSNLEDGFNFEENHPFLDQESFTSASLLSM